MSHANAKLTPRGRLALAQCIVEDGWPIRRAAERFKASPTTAARWASRYRQFGESGLVDRPSRPHRCPHRTPTRRERRIIGLRVSRRWGPARIGYRLGMHPSTVHKVLARYGMAKLTWLDRATGREIRRYEHKKPGDMVHVDIKKLGRIPDGGGHKVLGRAAAIRAKKGAKPGYAYLHHAVDDHSRLVYSEILRQYFPKGSDLSVYAPDYLGHVASKLNTRPRKRLSWQKPAEALDQLLSEPLNPPRVALTS